jgi:hypothetical protein
LVKKKKKEDLEIIKETCFKIKKVSKTRGIYGIASVKYTLEKTGILVVCFFLILKRNIQFFKSKIFENLLTPTWLRS